MIESPSTELPVGASKEDESNGAGLGGAAVELDRGLGISGTALGGPSMITGRMIFASPTDGVIVAEVTLGMAKAIVSAAARVRRPRAERQFSAHVPQSIRTHAQLTAHQWFERHLF